MELKNQVMPEDGRVDVSPLVIADIVKRNEIGFIKYGKKLQTLNGRDALQDLYEEMLDACQYLRQAIEEDLLGKLREVKRLLGTATNGNTETAIKSALKILEDVR